MRSVIVIPARWASTRFPGKPLAEIAGVSRIQVAPRIAVRHVRDHVLWLRFEDGVEGEVDLRDLLAGPVFEPLREIDFFRRVRVDSDLGTITWPNGADVAPESLYRRVRVAV